MKTWLIIVILMLIGGLGLPERLALLEELDRPISMKVDNGQLVFSDLHAKAHLYNMKTFEYSQISKKGLGPGEFPKMPILLVYKDFYYFYVLGKCMYFDRNGIYKKEFSVNAANTLICPLGPNFIQLFKEATAETNTLLLSLVTHSTERGIIQKKLLHRHDSPKLSPKNGRKPFPLLSTTIDFQVYDDKVFIHDTGAGLGVLIFDAEGNEAGKINLPYKKKESSGQLQRQTHRLYETKRLLEKV